VMWEVKEAVGNPPDLWDVAMAVKQLRGAGNLVVGGSRIMGAVVVDVGFREDGGCQQCQKLMSAGWGGASVGRRKETPSIPLGEEWVECGGEEIRWPTRHVPIVGAWGCE
jgi:hypothetical protein